MKHGGVDIVSGHGKRLNAVFVVVVVTFVVVVRMLLLLLPIPNDTWTGHCRRLGFVGTISVVATVHSQTQEGTLMYTQWMVKGQVRWRKESVQPPWK